MVFDELVLDHTPRLIPLPEQMLIFYREEGWSLRLQFRVAEKLVSSGGRRATLLCPILKSRVLKIKVGLVGAIYHRLKVFHLRGHVMKVIIVNFQTGLLPQLLSSFDLIQVLADL